MIPPMRTEARMSLPVFQRCVRSSVARSMSLPSASMSATCPPTIPMLPEPAAERRGRRETRARPAGRGGVAGGGAVWGGERAVARGGGEWCGTRVLVFHVGVEETVHGGVGVRQVRGDVHTWMWEGRLRGF